MSLQDAMEVIDRHEKANVCAVGYLTKGQIYYLIREAIQAHMKKREEARRKAQK